MRYLPRTPGLRNLNPVDPAISEIWGVLTSRAGLRLSLLSRLSVEDEPDYGNRQANVVTLDAVVRF